jgi:hypothetical protein
MEGKNRPIEAAGRWTTLAKSLSGRRLARMRNVQRFREDKMVLRERIELKKHRRRVLKSNGFFKRTLALLY